MAVTCCKYDDLGCIDICDQAIKLGNAFANSEFDVILVRGMGNDKLTITTGPAGLILDNLKLLGGNLYYLHVIVEGGIQCFKFKTI